MRRSLVYEGDVSADQDISVGVGLVPEVFLSCRQDVGGVFESEGVR